MSGIETSTEKTAIVRLDSIFKCMVAREETRLQLKSEWERVRLSGADPEKADRVRDVVKSLRQQEVRTLVELTLLLDDVRSHFKRHSLPLSELAVIESSRTFELAKDVASGTDSPFRGDGPNGDISLIMGSPNEMKRIQGIEDFLNIRFLNGRPYPLVCLIDDLLRLWLMFLRSHTEIDFDDVRRGLERANRRNIDLAEMSYSVATDFVLSRSRLRNH